MGLSYPHEPLKAEGCLQLGREASEMGQKERSERFKALEGLVLPLLT